MNEYNYLIWHFCLRGTFKVLQLEEDNHSRELNDLLYPWCFVWVWCGHTLVSGALLVAVPVSSVAGVGVGVGSAAVPPPPLPGARAGAAPFSGGGARASPPAVARARPAVESERSENLSESHLFITAAHFTRNWSKWSITHEHGRAQNTQPGKEGHVPSMLSAARSGPERNKWQTWWEQKSMPLKWALAQWQFK